MNVGTMEIGVRMDVAKLAADMHQAKTSSTNTANEVESTWRKVGFAIGSHMRAGMDKAKEAWDSFKEWAKTQVVIWGVALAVGISAAVLGAVYAAFKAVGFAVGLLTGDSYKSANIDALIAMNKEVKTLQEMLPLTAVGASVLNEALKGLGTSASAYADTLGKVEASTRSNVKELDRLGVKYKDQNGNLLTTEERLKSAAAVLATYREGWDRNQAAQAIGMGSEKEIQTALAVTAEKVELARERLIAYGLVIGDETQEAVKKYEEAMRAFNRESDLTSQGFKRAIADNIMPLLTQFAEFFKDGFPTVVLAFRYSMAQITSLFYGLKTVVFIVAETILGAVESMGLSFAGMAMAAAKALTGDFAGAKDALVQGWSDARGRLFGIWDNIVEQSRQNAKAMRLAWGFDNLGETGPMARNRGGKAWTPPPEAVVPDLSELRLYERAVKRLVDELGNVNHQSELEKLTFELMGKEYTTADGNTVHLTGSLERLTDEHKKMLPFLAKEIDARRALIMVSKLNGEAYDSLYKSQQQLLSIQTATFQADRDYLDDLQFQISLLGKTSIEQTKLNELRKIDLKLRQDLKAAADAAGDNMSQYDSAREALLRQAQDQRTAVLQGVNDRIQAERDWMTGANDAFNTYIDHARNAAEQSRNFFTRTFQSMEDALVEFARTGKLDFKKLADSIISDIIRIQVRAAIASAATSAQGSSGFGGFLGLFGKLLNFGGTPTVPEMVPGQYSLSNPAYGSHGLAFDTNGIQAFARGGLIGSPHHFAFADGGMMGHGIAGEAGPEAIFPLTRINGRLGIEASGSQGGPQIVVDQSGWTFGSDVNQATLRQWGQVIEQRTKAGIADSVRRGGTYKKMVRG